MSFLGNVVKGLGSVANTLIGGGLGYAGARQAARMSQQQAREQMAFQERMSNTAYQRAASDLEAAGLNRVLALGSPASSPGGASGQVPNLGASAAQGAAAGTAKEVANANIALTKAQTKKTSEEAKFVEATRGNLGELINKAVESSAKGIGDRLSRLESDMKNRNHPWFRERRTISDEKRNPRVKSRQMPEKYLRELEKIGG